MNIATLLITDKVVRLQGKDYLISNNRYTINGKLSSFSVGTSNYIFTNSFKINNKLIQGYCNLTILDHYKNRLIEADVFIKKENWFDDIFELAKIGDLFEINKVDFYKFNVNRERDFINYYNEYQYRFKTVDLDINFSDSKQYPPENADINSPNYSIRTHFFIDKNNTPEGKFYKKNFGDKVAGLQSANVLDKDIEEIGYYMISICSKIFWILEENLMQIFAINELGQIRTAIVDKYVNLINSGYDALPFIDKIIGELRKDWGIYYSSDNIEVKDFFPVLEIGLLNTYYNSLYGFYSTITLLKENTLFKYDSNNYPLNDAGVVLTNDPLKREEKDSDRRITKMISLLPSISFSLFSPQDRLKLLDKALEYSEIYENRPDLYFNIRTPEDAINDLISGIDTSNDLEDNSLFIENDIIKLVSSFNSTYAEANLLLDFLLETKSFDEGESITKYERLYNLINDKGVDNIVIVNWFVSEENNRARLILSLYKIWQKSKYYFYSQPPGVTMSPNDTNPENYFLFTTEGNNYYADYNANGEVIPGTGSEPILEFNTDALGLGYKFKVKFVPNKKIEKEKIIINRKIDLENFASDYVPDFMENNTLSDAFYGGYHLYQTISLVGYQIDEDIAAQVPQLNLSLIPAFLFHYVEEFDRLKNIYAGISFVIEIALEVGLFFATAGSSAALSLRHLRHITKIGRVATLTGTLESGVLASEVLLTWRVAEGAAEIVSMTAGVASSYLQYLATVNDDPFKKRLSYFFVAFALASVGGAIFSNRKVVKLADDILTKSPLNLIDNLQANAPDVHLLLQQVASKRLTAINAFATTLDALPSNKVKNFYNGLNDVLKPKFYEDFEKLDANLWIKLDNDAVLANWSQLANKNIAERKLLDFISNQKRVDTIVKFYDQPFTLRPLLEKLPFNKKVNFIDNFDGIITSDFNKFVTNPDLVTHWFRYFDENILRADFTSLTKSKQIKFLERYGNVSDLGFSLIKAKPKDHIKHLLDFPDATHSLAYFNKRRAEMLPPPFADVADGKIYGTQEVDSFIDLEIVHGGIARPSITSEAGDIVMNGGSLAGKSLDPMGPKHIISQLIQQSQNPNQFFVNWLGAVEQGTVKGSGFLDSIRVHFEKIYLPKNGKPPLDKVVIDYRHFEDISIAIGQNPNYFKNYIDNFISTNFSQYDNINYLIKLNY